jgi:putative membrane protein
MLSDEHAQGSVSQTEIQHEIKTLTYRHIAWLTALRYAMRQKKQWETTSDHKTNTEWGIRTPEAESSLEESLRPYLSEADLAAALANDNHQTTLLYQQSRHIKALKDRGLIWEFSFLELQGLMKEFFDLQGKTERIKNFPYPRQYASLNHYFMWLLLLLLPMALVPQFLDIGMAMASEYPILGDLFVWFTIPIYVAIAWMFHTMDRIGRTGENPFEGTSNDVPISTIARGIEIDLRQNLGEDKTTIPAQFSAAFSVQF